MIEIGLASVLKKAWRLYYNFQIPSFFKVEYFNDSASVPRQG